MPKSCLEVKFRGVKTNGLYLIEPKPGVQISTYCNMDTLHGGWTLLMTFASKQGWTKENSVMRKSDDPFSQDYSIFKYADDIKNQDPAEVVQ